MSDLTKEQRAIEAQRILESEVTQEALVKLEADYLRYWRQGKTVEQREDAHRYVTILDRFRGHFRSLIMTGELEAQHRAQLQPPR